ncbi:holin, partial [Streptococcus uberis]
MTINTEQAIAWMSARQGKVTYSMAQRDGASSYDCSSSIYYALRSAGASDNGWAVNTEYEHDWLVKNGYQLVAENELLYPKRGDIGIW